MILYNMRNRGPYEYDKFTLNILQIHNAVTLSEIHELTNNKANKDALIEMQSQLNNIYNNLIGTDSKIGLTEKIYINSFNIKEEQ